MIKEIEKWLVRRIERGWFDAQKAEYTNIYSKLNNLLRSDVETTLILPCCLCLFSSDHNSDSLEDNAKAKYGASLVCLGNIFKASGRNLEYLDLGTTSIFLNRSFIINSSSAFVNPEYSNNFYLRLPISSEINSGECSLTPALDNFFIKLNMNPRFINAWNIIFASITNSILKSQEDMPCLLAAADFTSSANLKACFFVSLLLDAILLASENSTSSMNSFTTLSNAASKSSFNSGEMSTLNLNSAILLSPNTESKDEYIKFAVKKPEPIMSRLDERQKKALHYTAKNQRITREEYTKINKISNATSKRDLKDRIQRSLLVKGLKEDCAAVPYRLNLSAISSASRTSTISSFLSNFSFDQRGQLNFNANATYSVSFVCGDNALFASDNLSSNSSAGTNLILLLSNANNLLKSCPDNFDFLSNSSLCASNSVNNNSGAIGSILPENKISIVLPLANKPEHNTFASITTSIYTKPENFFLYLACNDFDILLPILDASFFDNLLFATIDLNKASSETFWRIASLATSDQLMNLDSSISCFRSSGTDNVIVGIVSTSIIFNYVYYVRIYKSFGNLQISKKLILRKMLCISLSYKSFARKSYATINNKYNKNKKENGPHNHVIASVGPSDRPRDRINNKVYSSFGINSKNKEIKGSQNQAIEPVRITPQPFNNGLNKQLFKSFGLKWKTVGWQNQALRLPEKRVAPQPSGFKTQSSSELRVPALQSTNLDILFYMSETLCVSEHSQESLIFDEIISIELFDKQPYGLETGGNNEIEIFCYIDQSERLIGYLVIEDSKIKDLLPKLSRLRHYRESKKRKLYLKNVNQSFKNNSIESYFLKLKIKRKTDSIEIYSDVLMFLRMHDNCLIFVSVDDNQFRNFRKLVGIIDGKSAKVVKESELKRGTPEYQISLVLDNMLNIARRRVK